MFGSFEGCNSCGYSSSCLTKSSCLSLHLLDFSSCPFISTSFYLLINSFHPIFYFAVSLTIITLVGVQFQLLMEIWLISWNCKCNFFFSTCQMFHSMLSLWIYVIEEWMHKVDSSVWNCTFLEYLGLLPMEVIKLSIIIHCSFIFLTMLEFPMLLGQFFPRKIMLKARNVVGVLRMFLHAPWMEC